MRNTLITNKTSGLVGIPALLLKKWALEFAPILNKLFHLRYDTGTFTDDWKNERFQPIPKKGSKAQASNYRSISVSKFLEKSIRYSVSSNTVKSTTDNTNIAGNCRFANKYYTYLQSHHMASHC